MQCIFTHVFLVNQMVTRVGPRVCPSLVLFWGAVGVQSWTNVMLFFRVCRFLMIDITAEVVIFYFLVVLTVATRVERVGMHSVKVFVRGVETIGCLTSWIFWVNLDETETTTSFICDLKFIGMLFGGSIVVIRICWFTSFSFAIKIVSCFTFLLILFFIMFIW